MVNAKRAFNILVDEITGELKELIEQLVDEAINSGALDFFTELSTDQLLEAVGEIGEVASRSGTKIINNTIIEIMRLAIQQAVHKVFVKNFGPAPKLTKRDAIEMEVANAIMQRVSSELLTPMNLAAGAAIGGAITANPILAPVGVAVGQLAGAMATAFEEAMLHELLIYEFHFLKKKFNQLFHEVVDGFRKLGSKEGKRNFLENMDRARGKLRKDFNEIGRFFKGKHKKHKKNKEEPVVITDSGIRPMVPGKLVEPSPSTEQPSAEQPSQELPPEQLHPFIPPSGEMSAGPLLEGFFDDGDEDGDLINISFFP